MTAPRGDLDATAHAEVVRSGDATPSDLVEAAISRVESLDGELAVSLPLGSSVDDLPIGVQLVGAYGREDMLLRVAGQLEKAAPWKDRRPEVHA